MAARRGAGTLPPPLPDKIKPAVVGPEVLARLVRAGQSGTTFTAQKGKKKRKPKKPSAPVGTKVSFGLTEAGVRELHGRAQVQRPPREQEVQDPHPEQPKPKCDLWTRVAGSFTVTGKTGSNSFTFRGRMGGKSLKTGDYRLKGTATDAARNKSVTTQKSFKIVK